LVLKIVKKKETCLAQKNELFRPAPLHHPDHPIHPAVGIGIFWNVVITIAVETTSKNKTKKLVSFKNGKERRNLRPKRITLLPTTTTTTNQPRPFCHRSSAL
jgi:hypothetical protein